MPDKSSPLEVAEYIRKNKDLRILKNLIVKLPILRPTDDCPSRVGFLVGCAIGDKKNK